MDDKLKELLLSFDDVDECEAPSGFNYLQAMEKVKQLKPVLQELLGEDLGLDEYVQDASFFTDLYILEESQKLRKARHETYVGYCDLSIRFSSFGNMVTIFSNNGVEIHNKYPIDKLIEVLQRHGYLYIDAELLDEYYDGPNKYLRNTDTWWIRYFDYL